MKLHLLLLLVSFTQILWAQNKSVELFEKTDNGKVILTAKNNTESDYKVTVKINLANAQTSVPVPIEEIIPAGEELFLVEISALNPAQSWTYSIGYSYEQHIDQVNLITDTNTLVVFTMDGCGRCRYTVDFLNKNNIAFTEYNTTNNDANNMAMWQKLKANSYRGNSIKMPVIVTPNETLFNISNLQTTLDDLFLVK